MSSKRFTDNKKGKPAEDAASPSVVSAPTNTQPQATKAEIETLVRKISEKIAKNPDKAATILTEWVNQSTLKKNSTKKSA